MAGMPSQGTVARRWTRMLPLNCIVGLIVRENEGLSRSGGDLLSHVLRRSTIGATALNGRVRDGIGCFACAMTTRPRKTLNARTCSSEWRKRFAEQNACHPVVKRARCPSQLIHVGVYAFDCPYQPFLASTGSNQAYRAISTGQLSTLPHLHLQPIDVVVYHGPQGYLVLRGASRLDAFSGYPVRS